MRKKIDPLDLLIILLMALILSFMLLSIYKQLIAVGREYGKAAAEQAALSGDRDRLDQLARLKNRAAELKDRMEKSNHLLPENPEEEALLADITALAGRCGVQVEKISLEERISGQEYSEMPFTVTFSGRYHSLVSLLNEMGKGPRAVRIDEVKLGKGDIDLPYLQAEISASAFYTDGKSDQSAKGN